MSSPTPNAHLIHFEIDEIVLQDVDGIIFEEVLNLWCGKDVGANKQLGDVMVMTSVADRLQMSEVVLALEQAVIGEISTVSCAEVLVSSKRLGLRQIEEAAWTMAVDQFEEISKSARFTRLDEETLGRLLQEDGLGVRKEEGTFEALVRWMKGGEGCGLRGRGLLQNIRFGVMDRDYLEVKVREMLADEDADWVDGLLIEALAAKDAVQSGVPTQPRLLGAKALTRRRGTGVEWARYSGGHTARRLGGHSDAVGALVECGGRGYSGSDDGTIRGWSGATQAGRGQACRGRGTAAGSGTVRAARMMAAAAARIWSRVVKRPVLKRQARAARALSAPMAARTWETWHSSPAWQAEPAEKATAAADAWMMK